MKLPRPIKISGIYVIQNNINGKCYIGSAKDIKDRWRIHLNLLRRNEHHSILLQRSFNKYGEKAFNFEIISFINDLSKLIETEQIWLNFFKPELNIAKIAGSRLGLKATDETRKKMSESHKGLNSWNKGLKASNETKLKMSENKKGNKNSNAKKVTIDGICYNTITEAAKAYNLVPDYFTSKIKKGLINAIYE